MMGFRVPVESATLRLDNAAMGSKPVPPAIHLTVNTEIPLATHNRIPMDYSATSVEAPARLMDDVDNRVRSAVARHLGVVWRVLRRAGLNAADADDATQDVFWVLARRHEDVPERSERAFLVATAMRVASDRRRSKWQRSVVEPIDEALRGTAPEPDEQADARRQLNLLDRALDLVDEAERRVFLLMDVEEFSKREAAEALGIPEGTVASRLRRARVSLREALASIEGSEKVTS
jgi:RNA polymerase sigma-70 factor, ECF subfamily